MERINWTREKLINYFQEEILPNEKSLKYTHLRKNHRRFIAVMDKKRLITFVELYALFDLDYDAIKKEPRIWTFKKAVEYLTNVANNGEDVHPTYLYMHHNNFYTQFRNKVRKGYFTEVELYDACGLDYDQIIRKKKYPDKSSLIRGLVKFRREADIPYLKAKYLRDFDTSLYLAILEFGEGDFNVGIDRLDFIVEGENRLPIYKFNIDQYKKLTSMYGHYFEKELVPDILKYANLQFKKNSKSFNGRTPDFIHVEEEEILLDAKLTTGRVNEDVNRIDGLHNSAKEFIYIYLHVTDPLVREIPENTKVIDVFDLLEQIKNKAKREYFRGGLETILGLLLNMGPGNIEYIMKECS